MQTTPSSPAPDLVIAILAGGRSSRMGRDKAHISINGTSMLERTSEAAAATGYPVMVIGRDGPMEHDEPVSAGMNELSDNTELRYLPDLVPGSGPAGGLLTAISVCNAVCDILLTPCDTPGVQTCHFQWLIQQWQAITSNVAPVGDIKASAATTGKPPPLGLIPVWQQHDQPLFAVYSRHCEPILKRLMNQKKAALRDLIVAGQFSRIELPPVYRGAVQDLDTPQDLKNYRQSHT